ncbi:STE20-like serine/threonine-protein kinase [Oopsacas minuta]|uniref:STE20-like serine/threonine-protein kinase n=1 Tax=Oopsacas minuta TaxID=111878 RepID=A0AAV7K4F1_9METZ|nr:STE20-like serine/threonine-protein kinase [Oopsacas minuta]
MCSGQRYTVQIDRLEKSRHKEFYRKLNNQHAEYKSFCKKSRIDQNNEIHRFKDELKRDGRGILREFKQHLKKQSNGNVKEEVRNRIREIDSKNMDKVAKFEEDQLDIYEEGSLQMLNNFKNDLMVIEIEFLKAKHNLLRAKEADVWEMEQSQIQINHNMVKNHLSESFLMRRHQMHIRHQKDIEHHRQYDAQRLEIMRSRHLLERRRLPKQQRVVLRKLLHDFKRKNNGSSRRDDRDKYRQFEADELRKMRCERIQLDKKLDKEMTDFKQAAESAMIELLSLQNEKKMHLTQQENDKLNEKDELYQNEINLWRNLLSDRKRSLENDCEKEISELQLEYYHKAATDITSLTVAPGTSRSFRPRITKTSESIPSTNIDD